MSGMKDDKKKKPIEKKMGWKNFCLLKKLPNVIAMVDIGWLSHLNSIIAFSSDGFLDQDEFSSLLKDLFRDGDGKSYETDANLSKEIFEVFDASKVSYRKINSIKRIRFRGTTSDNPSLESKLKRKEVALKL